MSSIKTETIILEKGDTGLGFNIRGGIDNIHVVGDSGIFVTTVKANGAAAKDGRLQPGDKILEINGNNLRQVLHHKAVGYFHDAGDTVTLLVERGAEQRITNSAEQASPPSPKLNQGQSNSALIRITEKSHRQRLLFWIPISIIGTSIALWWFWHRRRS